MRSLFPVRSLRSRIRFHLLLCTSICRPFHSRRVCSLRFPVWCSSLSLFQATHVPVSCAVLSTCVFTFVYFSYYTCTTSSKVSSVYPRPFVSSAHLPHLYMLLSNMPFRVRSFVPYVLLLGCVRVRYAVVIICECSISISVPSPIHQPVIHSCLRLYVTPRFPFLYNRRSVSICQHSSAVAASRKPVCRLYLL